MRETRRNARSSGEIKLYRFSEMEFFNRFISAHARIRAYNAKARLMKILLRNYYENTDSRSFYLIHILSLSLFSTRYMYFFLSQGLHSYGCDLLIHNQKMEKVSTPGKETVFYFFRYIFYQCDCTKGSLTSKTAVTLRSKTIKV